jgi:hypothetical protein
MKPDGKKCVYNEIKKTKAPGHWDRNHVIQSHQSQAKESLQYSVVHKTILLMKWNDSFAIVACTQRHYGN